MVNDVKLQTDLRFEVSLGFVTDQLVLTVRHASQTQIGASEDPIEVFHLDVGFEHDLFFAAETAVCRFGKRIQPKIIFFDLAGLF